MGVLPKCQDVVASFIALLVIFPASAQANCTNNISSSGVCLPFSTLGLSGSNVILQTEQFQGVAANAANNVISGSFGFAQTFNILRPSVSAFASSGGQAGVVYHYVVGFQGAPSTIIPIRATGTIKVASNAASPGYGSAGASAEFMMGGADVNESGVPENFVDLYSRIDSYSESSPNYPAFSFGSFSVGGFFTSGGFGSEATLQSASGDLYFNEAVDHSSYKRQNFSSTQGSASATANYTATYVTGTNSLGFGQIYILLMASAGAQVLGGTSGFVDLDPFIDIDPKYLVAHPGAKILPLYGLKNEPFAAAVPEPDTWVMLIAGLGIVGGISRHRRSKVGARVCAS